MFPPAGASVYYNDAGEPVGWDSGQPDDPYEPGDFLPADDYEDQERDRAEEEYNRKFCGACGASPCQWDGVPDGFHTERESDLKEGEVT